MRLAVLLLAMLTATASAQSRPPPALGPNEGVVLKVDRKAREIAIRHGPLPELGMDAMSMYFEVADASLLTRVKKGDRVTFKAGLVNGRFAVISIQRK